MVSISNLTASNASFVLQHQNYMDFNVWLLLVASAFVLMLISQFIYKKDQSGGIIISVLSFLIAVSSVWGSLSVAHFGNVEGASSVVTCSTTNMSTTYSYIYSTQNVVASPILTVVCILLTIFTVINTLIIFMSIMEEPKMPIQKMRRGATRIDGKERIL